MKMKLLTTIVLGIVALSCSKHDTAAPRDSLTGDWKNVGYGSAVANVQFTPVPDSIKNFLQFDEGRLLVVNNNVQSQTGYNFIKSLADNANGLLAVADSAIYPRQYNVTVLNDTLILCPHNVNGAIAAYFVRSLKKFGWQGNGQQGIAYLEKKKIKLASNW